VGHGADTVSFWQWRSPLNGQEQYFGVVLGPDGKPNPIYSEIAQIGAEFARAEPALAGTHPDSTVALLDTTESRWALDYQRLHDQFGGYSALEAYYGPLRAAAQ